MEGGEGQDFFFITIYNEASTFKSPPRTHERAGHRSVPPGSNPGYAGRARGAPSIFTTPHTANACRFVHTASASGVAELDVSIRRSAPPVGPETSSVTAFPADRGSPIRPRPLTRSYARFLGDLPQGWKGDGSGGNLVCNFLIASTGPRCGSNATAKSTIARVL